jgi:hypothetical protein
LRRVPGSYRLWCRLPNHDVRLKPPLAESTNLLDSLGKAAAAAAGYDHESSHPSFRERNTNFYGLGEAVPPRRVVTEVSGPG